MSGEPDMSTKNKSHVSFKTALIMTGALLAGLVCLQPAVADERVDQEAVELLVLRVGWGLKSQGNAEAYLGRNLAQKFYRVHTNGESGQESRMRTRNIPRRNCPVEIRLSLVLEEEGRGERLFMEHPSSKSS